MRYLFNFPLKCWNHSQTVSAMIQGRIMTMVSRPRPLRPRDQNTLLWDLHIFLEFRSTVFYQPYFEPCYITVGRSFHDRNETCIRSPIIAPLSRRVSDLKVHTDVCYVNVLIIFSLSLLAYQIYFDKIPGARVGLTRVLFAHNKSPQTNKFTQCRLGVIWNEIRFLNGSAWSFVWVFYFPLVRSSMVKRVKYGR